MSKIRYISTAIYYLCLLVLTNRIALFISKVNTQAEFLPQVKTFYDNDISKATLCSFVALAIIISLEQLSKIDQLNFTYHCRRIKNSKALSNPTITSICHFSLFGLGIYFSVISSPIKEWLADNLDFPYRNSLFYAVFLLLITMVLFIENLLSIKNEDKKTNEQRQQEFDAKIGKLERLIQLAPASDFSKDLAVYVDIAEDWAVTVTQSFIPLKNKITQLLQNDLNHQINFKSGYHENISSITPSAILENAGNITSLIAEIEAEKSKQLTYIRALLAAYARLAAFFDGRTPEDKRGHVYRSNLMLKKSRKDEPLPKDFKFMPAILKGRQDATEYYLSLKNEYSVKIDKPKKKIFDDDCNPLDFQLDADVSNCSFPLFLNDDIAHYNCFGAPTSVFEVKSKFIPNTIDEVDQWEKKEPGKEIIKDAREYYENQLKAQSIISIPLQINRYSSNHSKHDSVMGVINIYRDEPNMMQSSNDKMMQFSDITTSLNCSLARITFSNIYAIYYSNFLQELLNHVKVQASSEEQQDCEAA